MAAHNDLGKKGEDLAFEFLQLKGYQILEKNWRIRRTEIDLIAMDKQALVFIEVKTRSTDAFGKPEEFITSKKQNLMTLAAPYYMQKINHDWEIRFDVISILFFKDETYQIEHIEDAFY